MIQTLRNARILARLVLAWFVLSIGVAVASPLVKPQLMELICSGSGVVKLLVQTDDGMQEAPRHTLDCPLCVHTAAPPPALPVLAVPSQPLAHALTPLYAAEIQALTAAPLSARAPPSV